MKTQIKKTLATLTAIAILLTTIPAMALSTDSLKKKPTLTTLEIEELNAALDLNSYELIDDSSTFEFYDQNDKLIFSAKVKNNEIINDKKFVSLMAKSDFFMELGNTSVYILNRN